jgi:hypothetical protein
MTSSRDANAAQGVSVPPTSSFRRALVTPSRRARRAGSALCNGHSVSAVLPRVTFQITRVTSNGAVRVPSACSRGNALGAGVHLACRRADIDSFLSGRVRCSTHQALTEAGSKAHIHGNPFAIGLRLASNARGSATNGASGLQIVQTVVDKTCVGTVTLGAVKGRHCRIVPSARHDAADVDCLAGAARLRACARVSSTEARATLLYAKLGEFSRHFVRDCPGNE